MRVFLDANVLFSAAHRPQGKAALLIEISRTGYWEVVTSSYAILEARRNLQFKFPSAVENLDSLLTHVNRVEHHTGLFCPDSLPKKDRPIFQAALACSATHLVTGDFKDFGALMGRPDQTKGIRVMSVADLLRSVLSASGDS